MNMSIGLILWLIIGISLNGLTGWYFGVTLFVVGFFMGLIQEQIKYNKTRRENDNTDESKLPTN